MTTDDKRLKEINHELWEIEETMKQLKKRTKVLTREKLQINGYHKIIRSKQKYHKGGMKHAK